MRGGWVAPPVPDPRDAHTMGVSRSPSAQEIGDLRMDISASAARRSFTSLIKWVIEGRVAVEIVSSQGAAVLMPADENATWQETAYLLRSPANALRLID